VARQPQRESGHADPELDTATEVGLLGISATQAAQGLSI
jgi:hypothetical protein